jgi:hypothetical protein
MTADGHHMNTMSNPSSGTKPKFCSDCGTQLNVGAAFCHVCGSPTGGRAAASPSAPGIGKPLLWGIPVIAIVAVAALTIAQMGRRSTPDAATVPLADRTVAAPDISSMTPEERADRLFNRVMRLSSEGKKDSAAFFAPMAFGALAALEPLDAHRRYDLGLISLVSGNVVAAKAQADTILAQRPTHLLGLSLAARVADARNDTATARAFRARLLAAEPAERAAALPEYTDHDNDVRAALELARKR